MDHVIRHSFLENSSGSILHNGLQMRRKARTTREEAPITAQALEDKSLSLGGEKGNGIISKIITIEVIPVMYNKNKNIDFCIGNI